MNIRSLFILAISASLCLIAPSKLFAQTPQTPPEQEIEAQLDALEADIYDESTDEPVAEPAPGIVQSMNPDIAFILDLAGAWFSDDPDLRGGHDPANFGFNLQALELSVGADVGPYFRFDAALAFHLFGLEIEEAVVSTLALPLLFQARMGQFKTRFGRLNPTHLHTWTFVTQPLVNAKFLGGEGLRGLGVELSRLELWMPGTFRWYVALQNISGAETGRSFIPAGADIASWRDLTLSARAEEFVALAPDWDLLVGISYANGRNKSGRDNRSEIYGADAFLKWRARSGGGRSQVGWQTEAMLRRRQIPGAVLQDFGLYSWIEWRLNRRWAAAIRAEYVTAVDSDSDANSIEIDPLDPLDPNWTEDRRRAALQLSFYPSHFSRLRLQYGLDHLPYRDAAQDEWVHMVLFQAEFIVGAHGAHTY
jgi:hypothetical protein